MKEQVFEDLIKSGREVLAELPRGIFGNEKRVQEKVKKLFDMGIKRFFCPTIDAAVIVKKIGGEITASFGSNIFNSLSLDVWKKHFADEVILSPEMTVSQINKTKSDISKGLICYGKLPLMLTRNCPIKNSFGCDECKKKGKLTDRKGIDFSVDCSSGTSEILNSVPVYIFDELNKFNDIQFFVLKFTTETKEECKEIIRSYFSRKKPEIKFTRGLYFRGVI